MKRHARPVALLATLALTGAPAGFAAQAEDAVAPVKPNIEQIGEERYRVGEIIVDKAKAELTVPATVLHLDDPLEYLAVARGGMKEYESLLEIAASATEFNLACILIGLDDKDSVKPRYQFDERKTEGMAVAVTLHWQDDGKTLRVSGANAMSAGEKTFDDDSWVYIGSEIAEHDGQFMAEMTGSVISFVHDPFSVIDHENGAGIGAYGLLTGNNDLLPPEGSIVNLTVSVIER